MEEIKNFIYSHSSPNGCVALTRSERDELVIMVEALEEDNLNKQELINDYVFENAKLIKENERLSQMIDVSFMSFLPRSLEMVACSQCEYDDFGYCRINKRDNVDYKHCKERYREALLKRAELEKRVEVLK